MQRKKADLWPCENPDCDNWFVPNSDRHIYCSPACGRRNRVQSHYIPVIFVDEKARKADRERKEKRLGRPLTPQELKRL
jgi:hypothetical protein